LIWEINELKERLYASLESMQVFVVCFADAARFCPVSPYEQVASHNHHPNHVWESCNMRIQCCTCNAQHKARRLIGWEASYQKQTGLDLGRRKILDHLNHHPFLQHPPTLYSSTCVAVQSRPRNQTVLCISNREQYPFSCTSKQLPPRIPTTQATTPSSGWKE